MALPSGTRIGIYAIVSKLGEGGMGEVYVARDTRLDRDVALKVLPELFTSDPDRLARFEREAKVLASLNHPNIAQVYGFEGNAIAMELVDGETLEEIIRSSEAGPSGPADTPDSKLMTVPVSTTGGFVADKPAALFDVTSYYFGGQGRNYDVTADGQRFVMIKEPAAPAGRSQPITVIVNWAEELRAKIK